MPGTRHANRASFFRISQTFWQIKDLSWRLGAPILQIRHQGSALRQFGAIMLGLCLSGAKSGVLWTLRRAARSRRMGHRRKQVEGGCGNGTNASAKGAVLGT